MELIKKNFAEYPRESFKRQLDDAIALSTKQMTNIELYGSDDEAVKNHAVSAANLVTSMALRYLLVDIEGFKPWIIRKTLPRVIDLEAFPEYTEKLIKWLSCSPPYNSLGKVVYIHQIVRNFTTMELK